MAQSVGPEFKPGYHVHTHTHTHTQRVNIEKGAYNTGLSLT
jgi:hypothetical protein